MMVYFLVMIYYYVLCDSGKILFRLILVLCIDFFFMFLWLSLVVWVIDCLIVDCLLFVGFCFFLNNIRGNLRV